jgi:D-alanine-D-alanine ligase-like ATP-grasp enzyme
MGEQESLGSGDEHSRRQVMLENIDSYRILVFEGLDLDNSCELSELVGSERRDWPASLKHLMRFADACDSVVANFGILGVPTRAGVSASEESRQDSRRADADVLGPVLDSLGVDVVNLADKRTLDLGADNLESTLKTLDECNVGWFGGGPTLQRARAPHRMALPEYVGGGEIHFHGSILDDEDSVAYASGDSPGCAPLNLANVPNVRDASFSLDSFHIAFPHWGGPDEWRTPQQYKLAHRFLDKDYDLVLGAGGPHLQEICRKRQRWVVYGMGRGYSESGDGKLPEVGNGPGLPFRFWCVLEVCGTGKERKIVLRLYPVCVPHESNNFRSGPVSREEFDRVCSALEERPVRPWRFKNSAVTTSTDELGHHIILDQGKWPVGERPERLAPTVNGSDPNEWPLRGPSLDLEDKVLDLNKHMGAALLSLAAEGQGGETEWLANDVALIHVGAQRMLAHGYWAHETPVGTAIVADKVLTADLLRERDVLTPWTRVVESADEAVEQASSLGGPVVLKPRDGNKSRGVSTRLNDERQIRQAFAYAREHGTEVILQQHVEASEELRVMASSDRSVAVIKRVLPHVVGDGTSTIAQLIEDKNLQRGLNPSLVKRTIPIDSLTQFELDRSGRSLASIPTLGETVTVRGVAGLSVGADAHQAYELVGHDVRNTAVAAVAAIPGLDWGGVDLIIEKTTGHAYVIEINTAAGYGQALFPTYGEPVDVGAEASRMRIAATKSITPMPSSLSSLERIELPLAAKHAQAIESDPTPFGTFFRRILERAGYSFESKNKKIFRVTAPGGAVTWVRDDGLTTLDRSVVRLVVKRHEWVLALLDLGGVPRVRARTIKSPEQLRRFTEGRVSHVILSPISTSWRGPASEYLTEKEALERTTLPGRMLVQARPKGYRLRILATSEQPRVVISQNGRNITDEAHIHAAGRRAVEAVRAIPELRWAAVDVVVRPKAFREGRDSGVMVEGLSMLPKVSSEDYIVAGDFEVFCREILEEGPSGDR